MIMDLGMQYLTVHGSSLERWCRQYALEPFEATCPDCGGKQMVDIPFAGPDGVRGLRAEPCPCGGSNAPMTYTSPDLDRLAGERAE